MHPGWRREHRGAQLGAEIYVGDAYGKSVLRAIADYADEHGYCYPSLSRLAEDCDLSIDSVRRRLKLLEAHRIIVTFRCWFDGTGKKLAART